MCPYFACPCDSATCTTFYPHDLPEHSPTAHRAHIAPASTTRSASEKRPPTAAPATPVTHGPQYEQPPNACGSLIGFRAGRKSSRRTRICPERTIVSLHATPYEEMQQAPGHVSSRSKQLPLIPTNITAYRPQHRPAETATHTPTHAARHPRCTAPEKNSRPRTDAHHDISPIAPPSRKGRTSRTATHNKRSPQHRPFQKRPVLSPTHATSYRRPTPPPAPHATKSRDSSIARPRETARCPLPPYHPTARLQTIRPSSKPAGPNRTASRHKRKSARTERSVCADLHRVQGYPCGDITSSCRRWSSWRPSEPKPSLRQPSGPSERQPSWVRPF